jgi:hypothetical protein
VTVPVCFGVSPWQIHRGKTVKPGWSLPGFFLSHMKVFMRLFRIKRDNIGSDRTLWEMNNFDNWIRITYAEK